MKLIIRSDGSGSYLDLHDVELVIYVNDLPCTGGPLRQLPISGYVYGSMFRSLEVQGHTFSLKEWEAIAYAAWSQPSLRRGMYGDIMPDVGESWTAKRGGVPISWPEYLVQAWEADLRNLAVAANGS